MFPTMDKIMENNNKDFLKPGKIYFENNNNDHNYYKLYFKIKSTTILYKIKYFFLLLIIH